MRVPGFMYGTAWKEERTEALTARGLGGGLPRDRHGEPAQALLRGGRRRGAAAARRSPRDELFLQTKFTYLRGQDHRLPYDPRAPLADAGAAVVRELARAPRRRAPRLVRAARALRRRAAGARQDREAWGAMEALQQAGRVRLLGVSNVSREQLEALCAREAQSRRRSCRTAATRGRGWDRSVRAFCRDARHRVPGLLAAHRQPAPSSRRRGGAIARRAGRHAAAGRVPLRHRGRPVQRKTYSELQARIESLILPFPSSHAMG